MVIEAISEMDLSPADDALINRLLVTAFDDSFGDRSYFQQRHHLRLVQRSGAEIIGHMALCYRSVRLGDALVPIIGLADVATAPSMRGQGVASAVERGDQDRAIFAGAVFPAVWQSSDLRRPWFRVRGQSGDIHGVD